MFTIEQSFRETRAKSLKKKDFALGMSFAKPVHVKNRFTFKELTLVAGILVAVIIVLALWFKEPVKTSSGSLKNDSGKIFSITAITKSFINKTLAEIQF
jgi:hypothetical protein